MDRRGGVAGARRGRPDRLPGFETIDLPPQTSRRIPLGKALAAAAVGLRLSSEQKITAGVLSDNGGDAKATDLAVQVATPVLTGPGVLALSPGRRLAPTLQLASAECPRRAGCGWWSPRRPGSGCSTAP